MSTPRKPKVLVAMSGGVDSTVAAALLNEQGYGVTGATLKLVAGAADAVEQARRAADQLGIEHRVFDCTDRFERDVVSHFIREYQAGRTPNPCVRCNRAIKFGALLAFATEAGAEFLATGHYARRLPREERIALRRAAHGAKDQSYALAALSQDQLAHALFPLGELSKDEVRECARGLGLHAADTPESQDICFIPDNDYRHFLAQRIGPSAPGPILSTSGQALGSHHGLTCYTVGQRKGLGVAAPEPYYVIRLDIDRNALIVGHEKETYCTELIARDVQWCSMAPRTKAFACLAQIRYHHTPAAATAIPGSDGLTVRFDAPQRSVTPGQWVVLYDEQDYALAAGIINTFEKNQNIEESNHLLPVLDTR